MTYYLNIKNIFFVSTALLLFFFLYKRNNTVVLSEMQILNKTLHKTGLDTTNIFQKDSNTIVLYYKNYKITFAKNQDFYNQAATLQHFFSQGTISSAIYDIHLDTPKPYAIISNQSN